MYTTLDLERLDPNEMADAGNKIYRENIKPTSRLALVAPRVSLPSQVGVTRNADPLKVPGPL
jgi:hypothetical protein